MGGCFPWARSLLLEASVPMSGVAVAAVGGQPGVTQLHSLPRPIRSQPPLGHPFPVFHGCASCSLGGTPMGAGAREQSQLLLVARPPVRLHTAETQAP